MNLIKKALLGTGLAATALVSATPAMARDYRHHDNGTGAAVAAGIAGLAIGAIIASSNDRDRYDDRYYNGGYYNNGYYNQGYYPNYAYTNGGWYDGYRYDNGYFYDRQNRRAYDRNSWSHRGHDRDGRRDYSRNSYGRRGY